MSTRVSGDVGVSHYDSVWQLLLPVLHDVSPKMGRSERKKKGKRKERRRIEKENRLNFSRGKKERENEKRKRNKREEKRRINLCWFPCEKKFRERRKKRGSGKNQTCQSRRRTATKMESLLTAYKKGTRSRRKLHYPPPWWIAARFRPFRRAEDCGHHLRQREWCNSHKTDVADVQSVVIQFYAVLDAFVKNVVKKPETIAMSTTLMKTRSQIAAAMTMMKMQVQAGERRPDLLAHWIPHERGRKRMWWKW